MNNGRYIVIEGPEGVGKTTQILELSRRLQAAGLPVRTLREPDSQSDLTARALRQLTQDPRYPMNTVTEVLLYNAARSQSLQVIKRSVEQGVVCIVDRNYLTTLAIQYYGRGDVQDYETINRIINFAVNGVEPDLCIVMDAPVSVLMERLQGRGAGERFDNLDSAFLERVRAGYLWEAQQRDLPVVFATEDPNAVSDQIWKLVSENLSGRRVSSSATNGPTAIAEIISERQQDGTAPHEPPVEVTAAAQTPELTDEPLVEKVKGTYQVTAAGERYLQTAVTNTTGNVYAFTDKLSPITIAAAMARLSRRGDDMRITILDEFAGKADKDKKLLHRVITAYGDDSVQQLAGQHFVVENASNLVVKKIEWGRLAAYLEQSTRYIYFDEKDQNGHYKYYIPTELTGALRKEYIKISNQIFDLYSSMVKTLTDYVRTQSKVPENDRDNAWLMATKAQACDVVRAVLPISYTGTVGVYASGQAIESLIMHLLSDELLEARETGKQLLTEMRKTMPVFLERADKPDRGGATIAYRANTFNAVKKLADELLPANHPTSFTEPVTLTNYTVRNELDIIADMLYPHSNLSLGELQQSIQSWSYEQKAKVFKTYMGERLNRRHRPDRALEKIHYSFDIVSDYGVFKALQRHRLVDDLNWQEQSPRLGYDVPKLIEAAGLSDDFEACFDLSLQLYSRIQEKHGQLLAQYAVLQGHNLRWKVTLNAREAFQMLELRTGPQGHPAYRLIAQNMHHQIAEVHPLLAESMIFINRDEDPELTRLAAERYTQFKLNQLS